MEETEFPPESREKNNINTFFGSYPFNQSKSRFCDQKLNFLFHLWTNESCIAIQTIHYLKCMTFSLVTQKLVTNFHSIGMSELSTDYIYIIHGQSAQFNNYFAEYKMGLVFLVFMLRGNPKIWNPESRTGTRTGNWNRKLESDLLKLF